MNLTYYNKFITAFSKATNIENISQDLIEDFADEIHISKITIYGEIPLYNFTTNTSEKKYVIYNKPVDHIQSGNSLPINQYQYNTTENHLITITITGTDDHIWSDEELAIIHTANMIIQSCFHKTLLANQIHFSQFFDTTTNLLNTDGYFRRGALKIKNGNISDYLALFLNLRNMKIINKDFGNKVGDQIILHFASSLLKFCADDEIPARLGGDNFVAIIHKNRLDELLNFLSSIHFTIPRHNENILIKIEQTCGIYPIEEHVTDMEEIMQKASMAYRTAKEVAHQNQIIYTPAIENRIIDTQKIHIHFATALKKKEFLVYYQPKVSAREMKLVGCEALVRWKQENKIISPGKFIPILEESNAICSLDFYILNQVCNDLRNWLDQGIEPVRVSVNFSRRHLTNPDFVKNIIETLNEYEIPRKYIEIEITETTTESEQIQLENAVEQLHNENLLVSIDDFGSGYSSLNMLRRLPVDILKIDRSFITKASNSQKDRIVLTNIVKLSQDLGIKVVTEGVETPEQLALLCELNCYIIQGFLFDKPLSYEEFDQRVRNKHYKPLK